MVTVVEVGLLLLVLIVVYGVYRLIRAVTPLVVNAVVGLVVLLSAGLLGFGVEITLPIVLIVAFGGVPAAVLVIILAHLDIVFQPAIMIPVF